MAYGVFICTKCRKNAQIIEMGSSRTTRCQRCNATLMTRKLRIFYSSEKLEEVISARTQIQARIAENVIYIQHAENKSGPGTEYQIFGEEIDEKKACFIDNRKEPIKRKTDELILGMLQTNNKQMHYDELRQKVIAMDVDENRFDEVLKKMLQTGEIYSPSKDVIRIV